MEGNKKIIVNTLIFSGILLAIMLTLTTLIGLGKAGFNLEGIFKQFIFYAGPGVGFLLGIIIWQAVELSITSKDSQYGNSVGFATPGEYPSLSIFKDFSNFQIFLLFTIIFSILGLLLFVGVQQVSFTGIASLEQQFTAVDNTIYSAALVPASENLGAGFACATIIFIMRYLARKYNWSRATFRLLAFFFVILSTGLLGIGNHALRYSGSDVAIEMVLYFWSIGATLTMLTGSFAAFYSMHIINNLFMDLKKYISDEAIFGWMGFAIVLMIAMYVWLYGRGKKE